MSVTFKKDQVIEADPIIEDKFRKALEQAILVQNLKQQVTSSKNEMTTSSFINEIKRGSNVTRG